MQGCNALVLESQEGAKSMQSPERIETADHSDEQHAQTAPYGSGVLLRACYHCGCC